MNERDYEENLGRLMQASYGANARPAPELRARVLQNLKAELRAMAPAAAQAEVRGDPQASTQETAFETVTSHSREGKPKYINNRRGTIMSKLFTPWGLGFGAAASAAAVGLIVVLATPKEAQGKALEVMARGARAIAKLSGVHLVGQLRTAPAENFSAIQPDADFVKIELWKEYSPEVKWRVDKPGRIAFMDGKSTTLFIKPLNYALKLEQPAGSAFDTQWLHEMADLSDTLMNEIKAVKARGWPVTLTQQRADDGREKSVITVQAKSGVPGGDYLRNKFFDTADTRRVYTFDNQSELLESVRIFLATGSGEKLIFELTQIDYNPSIDAALFAPQLPANVTWDQKLKPVTDSAQYTRLSAEQAARAFFQACGRRDWEEAGKFCSFASNSRLQQYLGGVEVISLGQPFTSAGSQAQFVPYEIKLSDGTVKKLNLSLKRDPQSQRWFVDGGI